MVSARGQQTEEAQRELTDFLPNDEGKALISEYCMRCHSATRIRQASARFFEGRTFIELGEEDRARFLKKVIDGEEFRDRTLHQKVLRLYKLVRITVFRVFYSNFPEGKIPRDARGIPIPKPGELHQITSPNTSDRVTGWDIADYRGPLTWEQEEQQRAEVQKIHWHDNIEDLVVRYRPKPPKK